MSRRNVTPYPGLRAYRREEAALFFGRDGCVDEMVDRLAATRFLAVLGASGSGKSSLVRTGLLNALKLGLHPAGSRWTIADCHPGGRPFQNLARALLAARDGTAADPVFAEALDEFLRRGPTSLARWAAGNLPEGRNLLLIVDQFEELFRYGDYAGREQAEAFAALLLESARSEGRIEVVITMRSEFLGACALIPGLAEQINKGLYLARRMTRDECREAITGPARVVGFDIEPRLVTHILNDLSSFAPWDTDRQTSQLERLSRQADQLPLMQHALSRLWQLAKRRGGENRITLTLDDYLAIGELRGALDQHAGEIVAGLDERLHPLVRSVFRALIAGTNLSDAVRRPTRFGDLVAIAGAPRDDVAAVVEAFRAANCSFLRPPPPQPLDDQTVVDISHESLIRQWSSLSFWLAEEARARTLWTRLVADQQRHAEGAGELLSGLDFRNAYSWWQEEQPAEGWALARGGHFEAVKQFLERSREEEERTEREEKARLEREQEQERLERKREQRERRRLQTFAAVVAVFAVLAAGLGVKSFFDGRRITEANSSLAAANGSLAEAKGNLELKITELDASNRTISEEKARAEKANETLTKTNDELLRAKAAAEKAQAVAENAQAAVEKATGERLAAVEERKANKWRGLDAIIAQADRQIGQPGMAVAEIDRTLADGQAYLAGMADEEKDQRRSDLMLTRIALRAAAAKLEGGNYAEAAAIAGKARAELEKALQSKTFTGAETAELAASYRLQAAAYANLGETGLAGQAGRNALAAAERLSDAEELDAPLEKARAWEQLAAVLDQPGRQRESLRAARRCVEVLGRPTSEDRAVTVAQCRILAAGNTAPGLTLENAGAHAQAALDALDAVPGGAPTLQRTVAEALAQSWLGAADTAADRRREGREHFVKAFKLLDLPISDFAQRPRLREAAALVYSQIGRMYLSENDYVSARTWFDSGISRVDLADWKNTLQLARGLDSLLGGLLEAIEGKGDWTKDNQALADYDAAAKRRIEVLIYLDSKGLDGACDGCVVAAMQQAVAVQVRLRSSTAQPGTWSEQLALINRSIADRAERALGAPSNSKAAVNARRAWMGSVAALIDGGEGLIKTAPPAEQIKVLDTSENLTRRFLQRFPDSWIAQRKRGRILASLAGAFLKIGNKADALKAAENGAALLNRDALLLLEDWYRNGSGPVPRDAARAAVYETQLSSRSWGEARLQLEGDLLWTDGVETAKIDVDIEDRTGPNDDVVKRISEQLERLYGMRLSADSQKKLDQMEQNAQSGNESFFELAVADLSNDANSVDWLSGQFQAALSADNESEVVKIIDKQWFKANSRSSIREALKLLLSRPENTALRQPLLKIAKAFQESVRTDPVLGEVSALLLEVLIETASSTPDELADLYAARGRAREKAGDGPGAESDKLVSLVLKPKNADVLNSVSYDWADENRNIGASIELLQRAVEAEPDDAYIRDSLGWAKVKAGDLDGGLKLVESAQRDIPGEAEVLLHLGDIYRRLGRDKEAREKFDQALGMTSDARLVEAILAGQQLLLDAAASPAKVSEAAALLSSIPEGKREAGRTRWSADEIGVAIRGFDPVAYVTEKHPQLGSIEHFALWDDVLWLFSSAAHRDAFLADPVRYAPAYGGFCAYCVADGHKLHSNPAAWILHNNRLYLHKSPSLRDSWSKDPDTFIADADRRWPDIINDKADPDARSAFTSRISDAMAQVK